MFTLAALGKIGRPVEFRKDRGFCECLGTRLREHAEHHLFQPFSLRAWSVKNQWPRNLHRGDMLPLRSASAMLDFRKEPETKYETNALGTLRETSASFGRMRPQLACSSKMDWDGQLLCQCLGNNWTHSSSLISMVFHSLVCAKMIFKKKRLFFFLFCHALSSITPWLLPFWRAKFQPPTWIPLGPAAPSPVSLRPGIGPSCRRP